MNRHKLRDVIRETVSADPRSGAPPGARRAWRGRSGTGAIGNALRRLHHPTTDEPLPPDLAALLDALDAAERRNRA